MFTEIINCHVKEESEKLSVFQQGGVYLATKKIGKNNPKEATIRAENAVRQEWNDRRNLMEKLQKQSQAMKFTQKEISSLKKQLSETTGFFKGKVRKSLEGKIEQAEKTGKTYPHGYGADCKTGRISRGSVLRKDISEIGKLVREYNEKLRAWENQTGLKKEKPSEPPKKASIREKLHRYQQESRPQAKTDSKEEINGQRKAEQKMKKTIFEEMGGIYVRCGDYFISNLTLPEEEELRFC